MEFFSPVEYEIFLLSLRVAFWGVICSLPFAILVALLLARYSFPGKFILNTNKKKHILKPGDFLAVDSKQLHSEKTYSQGATILLGKRYKN